MLVGAKSRLYVKKNKTNQSKRNPQLRCKVVETIVALFFEMSALYLDV